MKGVRAHEIGGPEVLRYEDIPDLKPGPGEVDWIITLNGDANVFAVDDAGNVSPIAVCLVPPPPK